MSVEHSDSVKALSLEFFVKCKNIFQNKIKEKIKAGSIWINIFLTAIFAPIFVPLMTLFIDNALIAGVLYGFIVAILINWIYKYRDSLLARMESTQGGTLKVTANDIWVGHIADSELASFQYKSLIDIRNYVKQLLNAGKVVIKGIGKSLILVPVGLFWGGSLVDHVLPV